MQSKRRWLKVSESDLQKEHLSSVMNPILNSLVIVNNIEFRTLYWKALTYGSELTVRGKINTFFNCSSFKLKSRFKTCVLFGNFAFVLMSRV